MEIKTTLTINEQLWLRRFSKLRVDSDKEKGRAPHKPLLLLAVLDLLETGLIVKGSVPLCPDLVVRFQNFWPIVSERRGNKGDIRLPFHALSNDGVWEVFDENGRPSRARQTSINANLTDELVVLLSDASFRQKLRRLLIFTYFPPTEQIALFAALGFEDAADSREISALAEDQAKYRMIRESGRSARFKNEVISGYRFTCALTGYRLTTIDQAGIVEAAHIHALSSSRNNGPDNGLALSPTAHALFDMGMWSITDDLRILVKSDAIFTEVSPVGGFKLRDLHHSHLHLEIGTILRPHRDHLAWHRREHGFCN